MITPGQLRTVFKFCQNPGVWVRTFDAVVDEFDLRPDNRLAMWLAQCGFESSSFNVVRERLSYRTAAAIQAVYPHEFPTESSAVPYVLNPMALANFVYANKNGNGSVESGDGFKYRGGGLIQLTGRANYKGVGEALGVDLEARPKQIEISMTVAARSAGFFWKQNDLNAAADAGDFDYTTKRVNGSAMRGAEERKALWQALLKVMNTPTPLINAVTNRRAQPVAIDGLADPTFNSPRSLNNFNT